MARAVFVLASPEERRNAAAWAMHAPDDTRAEFHPPGRTITQNARMWAMLTEVAAQVPWYSERLTPEGWKLLFLDGLERPLHLVPNLRGDRLVNLGAASSELSRDEFDGLLADIGEFGAHRGVVFRQRGYAP